MRSSLPKVLQPLLCEPLISYPVQAVREAGITDTAVVVGHGGTQVDAYLKRQWPDTTVLWQTEQNGTGHAVQVTADWWKQYDYVIVIPGDVPLIPTRLFRAIGNKLGKGSEAVLVTMNQEDPAGYGRILRNGGRLAVVEEADATDRQRCITEVNSGVYAFRSDILSQALETLDSDNNQKEYYLPDVLRYFNEYRYEIAPLLWENPTELLGVNSPRQLTELHAVAREGINRRHIENAVKILSPDTTWIGPRVHLEPDVTLMPDVQLWGTTRVGQGTVIGKGTILEDAQIGQNCRTVAYVYIKASRIEANSAVGPFAYIRDGAVLEEGAFAGKFVEIKKSRMGPGSKVPHLSYIGDATIGENTNIGAGTITCNYDGDSKHTTTIGKDCFVGSDTMFVAPVTMHDGAVTGAGSVITHDVPEHSLAVSRARQRVIEDWVLRKKQRKEEEGGGK
ncbi:MAG: bifunctional UDP-N-acetylglucosamine diphosphorylase/glucosamine-1-phosphate N-acetyltransferase GlmU [Synergistales bacterium]|nr:bifunctional UDP-N-acetylglucosamine diphosphorylase/glucosamine-1-phosphate N-acetyltransferase GlmU [Synergistales bacterium]